MKQGLYKIDDGKVLGYFLSINEDGTVNVEHASYTETYASERLFFVGREDLYKMLIDNEAYLYNDRVAGEHLRDLKEWYYGHSDISELALPELNEYLKHFEESYSKMNYDELMRQHYDLCTGYYEL